MKTMPFILAIAAMTACGSTNTSDVAAEDTTTAYVTPTVENGEIVIDTDTLTEHPLYVNYDSNGTNIQMIAVNVTDLDSYADKFALWSGPVE
mgnify:CR=1 FL=1